MTVSTARQLIQQGHASEALRILAPLLREDPPPQGACLEFARVAFQTAFKFLALRAAEKESLFYSSPEAEALVTEIKSFKSSHEISGSGLPLISLVANSQRGEEPAWMRCFDSLAFQIYPNIEIVLLSDLPRSSWPNLPSTVSFIQAQGASPSKALALAQSIGTAQGEIISVIERPGTIFGDVGLSVIASLFKNNPHVEVLQSHRLYLDDQLIFRQTRLSEPAWSSALLLDPLTLEIPSLLFSWRGVFFRKDTLISLGLPLREDTAHTAALDAAIKIARSKQIHSVALPVVLDDTPVEGKSFVISPQERIDALKLINAERCRLVVPPPREAPRLIRPIPNTQKPRKLPRVSREFLAAGATLSPVISVITPVLNCVGYLERCIDSVLSQNYKNLEFIILDGGSTDGTLAIIRRYEKHLTFWKSSPDRGPYAAVQEGFQRSTGEIMTWINADDALAPYSLHLVACLLSASTKIAWVTGQDCIFTEDSEIELAPPISINGINYFNDGFDEPFIQQEGTFWRRDLWNRAGATLDLSLDLAADMELWTRFFTHEKLFVTSVPLGIFQRRDDQRSALFRARYIQEAYSVIQRIRAERKAPIEDPTGDGSLLEIPCEPED